MLFQRVENLSVDNGQRALSIIQGEELLHGPFN